MAILKKKAEPKRSAADNVAINIAGKIKSNIRELEGSLDSADHLRVADRREISLPLAQDVLKSILDRRKAVTIDIIQKFVADYYNLRMADLKSRSSRSRSPPRQIAMYLCKSLTHASLPEIGRSFGGKHHSTVIHSIRKVEDLRKKDSDFNMLIGNFLEGFR
jgi:chromosomal replication initiator protein